MTGQDIVAIYPTANEQGLNSAIIVPLLQCYGVDGFRPGILDTQNKLGQGILRNVREVEVMLAAVAKVETDSFSVICSFALISVEFSSNTSYGKSVPKNSISPLR